MSNKEFIITIIVAFAIYISIMEIDYLIWKWRNKKNKNSIFN